MSFQLDHNIFFQGLQAQQNRENSMWDAMMQGMQAGQNARALDMKRRQFEAQQAGDYEGNYQRVLTARELGQPVSPQDMAKARAYERFRLSDNAVNPATGNPYPKHSPVLLGGQQSGMWETLTGQPAPKPQSAWDTVAMGLDPVDLEGPAPKAPAPTNRLSVGDLQSTGDPVMDKIRQTKFAENAAMQGNPNMAPSLSDVMQLPPQEAQAVLDGRKPQLPTPQNPVQTQERYKTELKIAEDEAKATGDTQREQDQRRKGLQDLGGLIDQLIKDSEGTPSGWLEGAAATATNIAGKPNPQAMAGARFDSGKAISGLNARIAFLKGQGNITDKEGEQVLAFMPKPNDPVEIKRVKLEGAREYLNLLLGGSEKETQASPQGSDYFKSKYGLE